MQMNAVQGAYRNKKFLCRWRDLPSYYFNNESLVSAVINASFSILKQMQHTHNKVLEINYFLQSRSRLLTPANFESLFKVRIQSISQIFSTPCTSGSSVDEDKGGASEHRIWGSRQVLPSKLITWPWVQQRCRWRMGRMNVATSKFCL